MPCTESAPESGREKIEPLLRASQEEGFENSFLRLCGGKKFERFSLKRRLFEGGEGFPIAPVIDDLSLCKLRQWPSLC